MKRPPEVRRQLMLVALRDGATIKEMAERLEASTKTVRRELERLEKRHVLEREKRKRATVGRPELVYKLKQEAE